MVNKKGEKNERGEKKTQEKREGTGKAWAKIGDRGGCRRQI